VESVTFVTLKTIRYSCSFTNAYVLPNFVKLIDFGRPQTWIIKNKSWKIFRRKCHFYSPQYCIKHR